MKKITKILSSVLAASMVISAFAMNAFAASKAHTVTITPDKTTGLVAGDTVTVELTVDNTEKLCSFKYELVYDSSVFSVDTTKVSRLEKCIDKTWLDSMKDPDGDWAYYLGNPTYNVATAGLIKFAWAGAEGVEAEYAVDNRVVGKFYLTVNDGVANGTTATFSLINSNSMDAGETLPTDMVCAPVTVTVGTPAPAEKAEPTVETTAKDSDADANGNVTKGYLVSATVTAETKAINGITVTAASNGKTKSVPYTFTTVTDGTVKVAVNVLNVPADKTVDFSYAVSTVAE